MNYIDDLLEELYIRLPELSWKLEKLQPTKTRFHVPPGLFRARFQLGGDACIQEIKIDIQNLAREKNSPGAMYLAERIKQKVSVLVRICQLDEKSRKDEELPVRLTVKELSTRKQWCESLEQELEQLKLQRVAVLNALERKNTDLQPEAVLALQGELGHIEKRITLLQEELK